MLIIAGPCALGLATPIPITTAARRDAQVSVLIKDAEAPECMAKVDTLILDKTGTLTDGKPKLTDATTLDDESEESILPFAAALKKSSEHPLVEVIDGKLSGIVAVANAIKETTADALKVLHEVSLRIIMATGDNEGTVRAVAQRLGIDKVRAGVLPEDKKVLVDESHAIGKKIAMVDDGVNDAPA